ncbi:MAG: putative ABC transporter permease [Bacilli bacterium]|nr:putative ABC transporter permease [Bacilli bacterium]
MNLICTYILLFFIYSFAGWLLEVGCKLVSHHKFVNRGFLIGPYCPIYGFGALSITLLLKRYQNDWFTLFIMAMLLSSILEYATSFCLEKIFKTRWWDYSSYRFNINGRVCLETLIPFGLFGLFIMYVSNPIFLHLIECIPAIFLSILTILLTLGIIIDSVISYRILSNLKEISSEIRTDSTEKITALVKKEIIKQNKYYQMRLLKAFPKLQILYSKGIARRQKKQKTK